MTSSNPGDESDRELIARWRAGDSRAATSLVSRHADALARFAVSAGERDEIEELVQDTFVRAFGSLDAFRGESSLRTWLFTIERRLMLDRRRAEKRQRAMVSIEPSRACRRRSMKFSPCGLSRVSRTRKSRKSSGPPKAPREFTITTQCAL